MPSDYPTAVLGISTKADPPKPFVKEGETTIVESAHTNNNVITLIFCGVGGILLVSCGILVYLKKKKGSF